MKVANADLAHVTIFGETNSGKSSLFNKMLGFDKSIVSSKHGTTTDPVSKAMELIPFGPIVLTDTAGLLDKTPLGKRRLSKTLDMLNRTDYALYVIEAKNYNEDEHLKFIKLLTERKIPFSTVISKSDTLSEEDFKKTKLKFSNSLICSINDSASLELLKNFLAKKLINLVKKEPSLIDGILKPGDIAVAVIPIDSEAPAGRLIVPQVKFIRDCLDNGIICNVTTEKTLEILLRETNKVDLVVTDSQVFGTVAKIIPNNIKLTSFSILMARQKSGDMKTLVDGSNAIANLKDGDKVLIAEACTHTKNHEDIGSIKIPKLIKEATGKDINFEFSNGMWYPENLDEYALIIHCGGCMITSREFKNRLSRANTVPITNYGVALAYLNGILDRAQVYI